MVVGPGFLLVALEKPLETVIADADGFPGATCSVINEIVMVAPLRISQVIP